MCSFLFYCLIIRNFMKKQVLLFFLSISISNIVSDEKAQQRDLFSILKDETNKVVFQYKKESSLLALLPLVPNLFEYLPLREDQYQEAVDFYTHNPQYEHNKASLNFSINHALDLIKKAEALKLEAEKPYNWSDYFTFFQYTPQAKALKEMESLVKEAEETARIRRWVTDYYRAIPIAVIAQYQFNKRNADVIKQDPLLCVV